MKRSILSLSGGILAFFFVVSAVNAQSGRRMNMADFEKRKMVYVQKEAGLSREEANRYFPVSNELSKKKFELHRQHRQKVQGMKQKNANMTDAEYQAMLDNDIDVKLKEAELDKEYSSKFETILSPEKLYKAQQAEKKFMQEEVTKFREDRKNHPNRKR